MIGTRWTRWAGLIQQELKILLVTHRDKWRTSARLKESRYPRFQENSGWHFCFLCRRVCLNKTAGSPRGHHRTSGRHLHVTCFKSFQPQIQKVILTFNLNHVSLLFCFTFSMDSYFKSQFWISPSRLRWKRDWIYLFTRMKFKFPNAGKG